MFISFVVCFGTYIKKVDFISTEKNQTNFHPENTPQNEKLSANFSPLFELLPGTGGTCAIQFRDQPKTKYPGLPSRHTTGTSSPGTVHTANNGKHIKEQLRSFRVTTTLLEHVNKTELLNYYLAEAFCKKVIIRKRKQHKQQNHDSGFRCVTNRQILNSPADVFLLLSKPLRKMKKGLWSKIPHLFSAKACKQIK